MQEFERLIEIIRKLRGKGGCPWDRKQKLPDYKRYLIEEAYELIEAIDSNDPEMVKEELGDLFLILTVVSEFFNDKKVFNVSDSLKAINEKLIIRHPHVFSKKKIGNSDAVLKYWIKQKAKKKKRKTVADRLPKGAPALFLTELFCREYANIKAKDFKAVKKDPFVVAQATAKDILNLSKDSKDVDFARILFQFSVFAYARGVDLESALHNLTREQAANTPYPHKK
jgi:tetrapyrrole methylase family protein/MazG family protein